MDINKSDSEGTLTIATAADVDVVEIDWPSLTIAVRTDINSERRRSGYSRSNVESKCGD